LKYFMKQGTAICQVATVAGDKGWKVAEAAAVAVACQLQVMTAKMTARLIQLELTAPVYGAPA
jgi:hypothetical protein